MSSQTPFFANTTEPSVPVVPGQLRLSVLATIPEEPLGEDSLEATQQQASDSPLSPALWTDTPTPAVSQMVTYLFVIEELGSFNKSKA